MITEDYVSFETAKLLKEKGFDEPTLWFYVGDGTKYLAHKTINGDWWRRPTLQMAIKWLRKEHNLVISTSVTVGGWLSGVSRIKLDGEGYVVDIIDGIDGGNIPNCGTYEEACEAAIKYCLEKLI